MSWTSTRATETTARQVAHTDDAKSRTDDAHVPGHRPPWVVPVLAVVVFALLAAGAAVAVSRSGQDRSGNRATPSTQATATAGRATPVAPVAPPGTGSFALAGFGSVQLHRVACPCLASGAMQLTFSCTPSTCTQDGWDGGGKLTTFVHRRIVLRGGHGHYRGTFAYTVRVLFGTIPVTGVATLEVTGGRAVYVLDSTGGHAGPDHWPRVHARVTGTFTTR